MEKNKHVAGINLSRLTRINGMVDEIVQLIEYCPTEEMNDEINLIKKQFDACLVTKDTFTKIYTDKELISDIVYDDLIKDLKLIFVKLKEVLSKKQFTDKEETYTESMSIDTKPGEKVKFSFPNNGFDSDIKIAKNFLTEGDVYTIKQIEVYNWYTRVWLEEIEGISFNSVSFSNV